MDAIKSTLNTQATYLSNTANSVAATSQAQLDRRISPAQRSELTNSVRSWAAQSPILFYFLAAQLALSGPPTIIFLTFATFTLLTSLGTCIFLALVAALSFTAFCTGLALLILLPILFITTINAMLLFLAVGAAYWVAQRFSESETPVPFVGGVAEGVKGRLDGVHGNVTQARKGAESGSTRGVVNGEMDGLLPPSVLEALDRAEREKKT